MGDHRLAELVKRLHRNTQNKKLTWAPTVDENAFTATFPHSTVRLEKVRADYIISISNDQGLEVERFSDVELDREVSSEAPTESWFSYMGQLYEMARRQALRADETINAILGELE